jgi:hypothetical protein
LGGAVVVSPTTVEVVVACVGGVSRVVSTGVAGDVVAVLVVVESATAGCSATEVEVVVVDDVVVEVVVVDVVVVEVVVEQAGGTAVKATSELVSTPPPTATALAVAVFSRFVPRSASVSA